MKLFKLAIVVMLIVGLTATVAIAREDVLDVTITDMVEKVDKNGQPYIRFIAQFDRTKQGASYSVGLPIMAFGQAVEKGRTYAIGDQLKCVAKYREWNTSESYTILAYLEE